MRQSGAGAVPEGGAGATPPCRERGIPDPMIITGAANATFPTD